MAGVNIAQLATSGIFARQLAGNFVHEARLAEPELATMAKNNRHAQHMLQLKEDLLLQGNRAYGENWLLGYCFVAGTPIVTAQGLRPIEQIRVGDQVYATDTETGVTEQKSVRQLFSRVTDKLVRICAGQDTLLTTPEHPFYVAGQWVEAGQLKEGDALTVLPFKQVIASSSKVAGSYRLVVENIARLDTLVTVYNFAVEDFHTYYVGKEAILVHNQCRQRLSAGGNVSIAGKLEISSGLASKLGIQVSRLNNWLLKYADNLPNNAKKLLDELEGLIGNKQVLEVLEDGQKRLSVVLKTDGVTYDLIALQKNIDGEYMLATYNRAYNQSANLSIDVGVSQNRLVPDYTKTMAGANSDKYLYPTNLLPQGKSPVVKIKMTGKRRGIDGDFYEANKAAGLVEKYGSEAPRGYVWHHMDDFDPLTGECTMQLVKSDVHTSIPGMAHSGSVAQWKEYYKDPNKAPGGFYEK
jgi:hypothetical protein